MRLLRIVLSVVLVLIMGTAMGSPAAVGDPAIEPIQPPGPPPIAWPQLGVSDQIVVRSADAPQTVTLPVPQGTRPAVLTGQIKSVANAVNCRVEVYDGGRRLVGSIAPPEELTTSPFALDLSQASVGDKGVDLSFVLRQDGPPAELCAQTSAPASITLDQLATAYVGSPPAPATISDFLPDYLSQIVIHIGSNPSTALQQTALALVANLTHLYRPLPIRVDVDTSSTPMPPPADPYGAVRTIEVREDQTAGIHLVDPGTPEAALVISGKDDQLRRQVGLFADRRFELVQDPSADVTELNDFGSSVATVKKFGELGITGQVSVLGADTLYLGFDATQFGVGPIDGAEINLRARYTPIGDGEGSVVVRAGSAVIGTFTLNGSGDLDVPIRIPADAIQSNVGLALDVRYQPRQAGNLPGNRITFAVQPDSTVQVTPGTQTRRGFSELPMAFSPSFLVAVDEPDRIRYAAAAINLLGQQTATTLKPRLTTIDAAITSESGALIVASGPELSRRGVKLPVSMAGDGTLINGKPITGVELSGPIGVVQTATDNKRTVLAITASKDWTLVDKGFDYIRSLDGQWGALSGDVVATGALGKSINLTVNQGGGWQDLTPDTGWASWAWVSIAIASAAVLAGLVVVGIRLARRRRDELPDELPESSA